MSTRAIIIAIGIVIVLIIGFIFLVPHTKDVPVPKETAKAAAPTPGVTIHDVYKKGTHTITGSVLAPNACVVVTATANVIPAEASTTPATIVITISMPEDSGICLQVPTAQTFSLTAAAGSDALITATVNGSVASTTEK